MNDGSDLAVAAGVLMSVAGYSVHGMATHKPPADPLRAYILGELHALYRDATFPDAHRTAVLDWYREERSVRGTENQYDRWTDGPAARTLLLDGLTSLLISGEAAGGLAARAALTAGLICADILGEVEEDGDPRPPCRHYLAEAYRRAQNGVRTFLRQIDGGGWPARTPEQRAALYRAADELREMTVHSKVQPHSSTVADDTRLRALVDSDAGAKQAAEAAWDALGEARLSDEFLHRALCRVRDFVELEVVGLYLCEQRSVEDDPQNEYFLARLLRELVQAHEFIAPRRLRDWGRDSNTDQTRKRRLELFLSSTSIKRGHTRYITNWLIPENVLIDGTATLAHREGDVQVLMALWERLRLPRNEVSRGVPSTDDGTRSSEPRQSPALAARSDVTCTTAAWLESPIDPHDADGLLRREMVRKSHEQGCLACGTWKRGSSSGALPAPGSEMLPTISRKKAYAKFKEFQRLAPTASAFVDRCDKAKPGQFLYLFRRKEFKGGNNRTYLHVVQAMARVVGLSQKAADEASVVDEDAVNQVLSKLGLPLYEARRIIDSLQES